MTPRSGTQFRIAHGEYVAEIASVGATLRRLAFAGRDLVAPFDADEVRPAYRGTTLAPWPNRVVDGAYEFGGRRHELALTEPARGHALHGLLAWAEFSPREVGGDRVVLVAVVEPQAGYPFRVEVTSEYRVGPDGLTQTVTARNLGPEAAPWGTGPHPYLVAGGATPDGAERAGAGAADDVHPGAEPPVNRWTLQLPATEVLTVDDRLSPLAVAPVTDHPEWDFREPRVIGNVFIDHAFTGLDRDGGIAEVRLTAPDGTGVAMTWDDACPWVQVHTADTPGDRVTHRVGLAVEPMTCPPDAFNSGADLVVLEPGATHPASWSIRAL